MPIGMKQDPSPQPPKNIREAYERVHRCRPEHFQRDLLSRSISPGPRLLFLFLGWFRPHTFNPDWSVVEAVGGVRTAAELEDRLTEFEDLNLIDRSRRRGWLGVRVSPSRLKAIVRPLLPSIQAPAAPVSPPAENSPVSRVEFALPRRVTDSQVRPESGTAGRVPRGRVEELEEEIRRLRQENDGLLRIIGQNAVEIAKLRSRVG